MNKAVYKHKIGNFDYTIIKDLMFTYPLKDYFSNENEIPLPTNLKHQSTLEVPYITLLLEKEDKKILIDTGIGFSIEPIQFGDQKFYLKGQTKQLLKEQGIDTTEITDVILSHLHPDHIGGVYADGILNFPNATFHIAEKEWNFWHSSKAIHQPPLYNYFIKKNITPLKSQRLNLVKGNFTEILPEITIVEAPGHSPAQIALLIGREKEQLIYTADTFLHPLHIENTSWQSNYDFDHKISKSTRSKLLNLAHENNMLVQSFHFDFPGLGTIGKGKTGWKWLPVKSF